jgi:signal transduction histidine kinase
MRSGQGFDMTNDQPATLFAPPERATREATGRQSELLLATEMLPVLFDAVEQMILVLNPQRQIVFANRAARRVLGAARTVELIGLRPGEAVDCIHASEHAAGCGTSEACTQCGAVNVILVSQLGKTDIRECRISRRNGAEPLELLVQASPLALGNQPYTILSLRDISGQKRLEALERLFFHDIMNTAGAVKGLAEVLALARADEQEELRQQLVVTSSQLVEEIASHRFLTQAEKGDLVCSEAVVNTAKLVGDLAWAYRSHEVAQGKRLEVAEGLDPVQLVIDAGLLSRVIGNMLKNALEACPPGETVTIGCRHDDGGVRFYVHNPTPMPREVQLQVFQRSFSTKGIGRGLGTYSMKLLTERYLRGRVGFTSAPVAGTTFTAWFPERPVPDGGIKAG